MRLLDGGLVRDGCLWKVGRSPIARGQRWGVSMRGSRKLVLPSCGFVFGVARQEEITRWLVWNVWKLVFTVVFQVRVCAVELS